MTLRLDKYAIAGIVGVVFFISLGVYGILEDKIEKKVQIDYEQVLKIAQERARIAEASINNLQSKCNELFKSQNENEYNLCIKELSQKRMELTSAQVDLFDIKSKLGLE